MLDGIRGAMALVATLGIVAVLAGFLGDRHPAFDTLGAARLHAAGAFALLLLFSVAFHAFTARLLALVGLVIVGAGVLPLAIPAAPPARTDLRVLSHNVRYDNTATDALAAQIAAAEADVVLLQEVSRANVALLARLRRDFDVVETCPFAEVLGGVALLVRRGGAVGCAQGQGVAWARAETPAGPVTVASLHLPWPWPHGQQRQARKVAEILADLPEPLLIAGDFNIPPWGHTIDILAEATGTRLTQGLRLSFRAPELWPGLPLDHVLVSEDLDAATEQLDFAGSDHAAQLTRVAVR